MEFSIVKAVGVCFYCSRTNRYLYLLRNDSKYPSTWGLAGGKSENKETLLETINRECTEELGSMPEYNRLVPIEKFTSIDTGFEYNTFWCEVDYEFIPDLNDEHVGYAWIRSGQWPKPLHPGLWNTVNLESIRDKMAVLESMPYHVPGGNK